MQDNNAVVTGGASGLGRAFCEELGAKHCRVLVCDIDETGAQTTIERVRAAGGEARYQHCDVSSNDDVEAVRDAANSWFGHTDLLVNNAGVAVAGTMEEVPLDDWDWIMGINLWGVIYGCRAFLPGMKSHGSGNIINVASAAGLLSPPKMSPYNVTKSAVVALTETIHLENQSTGVNTTVLCPTFFPTNIGNSARTSEPSQGDAVKKYMERSKLSANDVAASALTSVLRNELYAVPMADGRNMWRLKRANPQGYARLFGSKRVQKFLKI
jgi:NAD(P)-dependent dehydrogenase (short-subunit alcohol dehydrogenase family)